ncbi:MAG: aminoacyl-tRNA hydrolase [Nitrospirae bacterium]|nr:aminoacyl-tRNA hydrolase [Nitrospirota bacterium]
MRLIVGLGNPGERYALTRHNIGWRVVDKAAARWAVDLKPAGYARWGRGGVGPPDGKVEVALAAPLTWMNEAGVAVKALLTELALVPQDLLVVHDDLDLAVGRLRIKSTGGTGGHNGILSIVTTLETNEFDRLKIGIGRPAPVDDAAEYVLSPFTPDEITVIGAAVDQAVLALECVVAEGVMAAMNRFNVRSEEAQG